MAKWCNYELISRWCLSCKILIRKSQWRADLLQQSVFEHIENGHQQITCENEIWDVFDELKVWSMYYLYRYHSLTGFWFNIVTQRHIFQSFLYLLIFLGERCYIFAFYLIAQPRNSTGNWNPSSWKKGPVIFTQSIPLPLPWSHGICWPHNKKG